MKNIYKQIDGLSQCKVYLYGKMINMRNFLTHDIKSFVAGYVWASANDVKQIEKIIGEKSRKLLEIK